MAKYTVIIATHDRPPLLARAIRTIKEQVLRDVRIIVVSDQRSTANHDVTRACLSGDDVYIERGGDPGPAQSRSYGLALADSAYVVFLDDDDEFSKEYLVTVDEYTKQAAGDGVLFCDFYVSYDGEDRAAAAVDLPLRVTIGDRDPQGVFVKNYIPNSCVIYPIDAVKGRLFDNSLVLNEDWDFLLNAMQGRQLIHVPVFGPIIHKTPDSKQDRRGILNHHLLPDTFRTIYKKWPAPTAAVRQARQGLFASVGISLPIEEV